MNKNFIPFNRPTLSGNEFKYLDLLIRNMKFSSGGKFTEKCISLLKSYLQTEKLFLTTSCTASLELAALLCDINLGDEIILPSFAYPTSASSFVRCGAKLRFVDIDPDTMNLAPENILKALSPKTKVVVVIHYGGVACDMDAIMEIAQEHNLMVIEDAAQAIYSYYKDKHCGTLGTFGCISFHQSKNIHCGEGGAFMCNDAAYTAKAEILMDKGTDRKKFLRGEVEKYTWQDIGSSFGLSDINSSLLLAQLQIVKDVTDDRLETWNTYQRNLSPLEQAGYIQLPKVEEHCKHNGHIFWIKTKNPRERTDLINFLQQNDIHSTFHFQPLHKSIPGKKYGKFVGEDKYTSSGADCLLRLPIFYKFNESKKVIDYIFKFFNRM